MDKRMLWALGAAGAYILLMSKGELGNFNKLLQEHGMMALIIGGGAYFLFAPGANGNGAIPAGHDEFADLPPNVQEQIIAQQNAANANAQVQGYNKGMHQPVAGFDPRYKPLGV